MERAAEKHRNDFAVASKMNKDLRSLIWANYFKLMIYCHGNRILSDELANVGKNAALHPPFSY